MRPLTLTNVLFFTSSVIAAPGAKVRRSHPSQRLEATSANTTSTATTYVYDTNWAGTVVETTGVTSVTGTFTVPIPSTEGSGAAWVGIDGNDCYTAILQTGVDWTLSRSTITYQGWYEWFPASMEYWSTSDFLITGGDVITATVLATSSTSGVATLENKSTGKTVSYTFTSAETLGSLCQTDAEWIVEDYEEDLEFVEFADFGTVAITEASYTTSAGSAIGLSDAMVFDIEQNNIIRTNSLISGSSSVSVSWIQ